MLPKKDYPDPVKMYDRLKSECTLAKIAWGGWVVGCHCHEMRARTVPVAAPMPGQW